MGIKLVARAGACALLTAVIVAAAPGPACAQDAANYPSKTIRIIVGFAAGGGNDIMARLVGQKLGEILQQTVVIENRVGAGGRLSAEFVAREPADGHTILIGAPGPMSVAAAIYPNLSYHPTKTFIPLAMTASFPLILVVAESGPVKTVKDLIAYAKANPDKANYATTSPSFTITTELMKLKTGMPGVAITYKSSNEMLISAIQGQTMYSLPDGPPTIPMVQGKQVRALAVTGAGRSPELPDVPSMVEAGVPEMNIMFWNGFFASAKTPPAIAAKLSDALRKAIQDPAVSGKLKAMAMVPGGNVAPDEFRRIVDQHIELFKGVVKEAKLTFAE